MMTQHAVRLMRDRLFEEFDNGYGTVIARTRTGDEVAVASGPLVRTERGLRFAVPVPLEFPGPVYVEQIELYGKAPAPLFIDVGPDGLGWHLRKGDQLTLDDWTVNVG
jgi:hypothetical protein